MSIPRGLAEFGARSGLAGAVIAVLLTLLVVQTVRLEGFKVWPISIEGAGPKADRLQRTIDAFDKAQNTALEAARAIRAAAERRYHDLAERIDDDADQAHAEAADDAERYIAANGVRCPTDRGAAGGAPAPAADRGARNSKAAGAAPIVDATDLVTVSASDVRICTTNTLQAEAGRLWALELERE